MREAVIVSAVRTPLGSFNGSLGNIGATQLGAIVIEEALRRAGVENPGANPGGPTVLPPTSPGRLVPRGWAGGNSPVLGWPASAAPSPAMGRPATPSSFVIRHLTSCTTYAILAAN